ncbi:hypothetical protein RchiOBHm_Chr5g0029721 [Rosa chinensis]|uniref:Uncharacterized protein n=2 Tax=Rosa chinensis TaxID=74649 RepID=A0A2P6Q9P4_ROSCH|nr:hypothetical protein RchiOBHm_Chr5g0029721 [Rosa chinensis]
MPWKSVQRRILQNRPVLTRIQFLTLKLPSWTRNDFVLTSFWMVLDSHVLYDIISSIMINNLLEKLQENRRKRSPKKLREKLTVSALSGSILRL